MKKSEPPKPKRGQARRAMAIVAATLLLLTVPTACRQSAGSSSEAERERMAQLLDSVQQLADKREVLGSQLFITVSELCDYYYEHGPRQHYDQSMRLLKMLSRDASDEASHSNIQLFSHLRTATESDSLSNRLKMKEASVIALYYQNNLMRAERDEAEKHNRRILFIQFLLCAVVVIIAILSISARRARRQQKEEEALRNRLLQQEADNRYRQSQAQIIQNQQKIEQIEQQLTDATTRMDAEKARQLELDAQQLTAENQWHEATLERRSHLLSEFNDSDLYKRIKTGAGRPGFRLSHDEWAELSRHIDAIYDNFTSRLLTLVNISEQELHVCYLLKLGISPTAMAEMLAKTPAAITMTRKRLYYKLTKHTGTAADFDTLIADF